MNYPTMTNEQHTAYLMGDMENMGDDLPEYDYGDFGYDDDDDPFGIYHDYWTDLAQSADGSIPRQDSDNELPF